MTYLDRIAVPWLLKSPNTYEGPFDIKCETETEKHHLLLRKEQRTS